MDLAWLEALTPEEQQVLLTEIEISLEADRMRDSLEEFVRGAWHIVEPGTPLTWNWHLSTICGYLEALEHGLIRNLIVNIPPGTMKSLIIGVFFPAWVWTRRPWFRWLCGANEQALATRDAQRTRDIVASEWYQQRWGSRINPTTGEPEAWAQIGRQQDEKTLYRTVWMGHREATGVMSRITGRRADALLWDDPHDTVQTESDVQRLAVTMRWDRGWSTRLNSQGTGWRILVMQRIHVQDMTGHLLATGDAEGWVHLVIPMRYDPALTFDAGRDIGRPDLNDPRTEPGELLFPDLFPEQAVAALEIRLGPYGTAGQLQQRPNPKGGGEFKREWIMRYQMRPRGGNRYIIVDPAGERRLGRKGRKDNTAMAVIELAHDQNYYLIDGVRDKIGLIERTRILMQWHRVYRPLAVGYEQYGKDSDIAHIQDTMERENYRFRIIELGGSMPKDDRIRRLLPLFQAGRFWLPPALYKTQADDTTIDIVESLIEQEYVPFPVAPFDDMMDAISRIVDPGLGAVFPEPMDTMSEYVEHQPRDPGAGY